MKDIVWVDLTVDGAEGLSDFYAGVMGWRPEPVSMGDYADFNMCDPRTGAPAAGVCHARGPNAGLPPVWLVYFRVSDLDAALRAVEAGGGRVLQAPRGSAGARFAVATDPAGATFALAETPEGGPGEPGEAS